MIDVSDRIFKISLLCVWIFTLRMIFWIIPFSLMIYVTLFGKNHPLESYNFATIFFLSDKNVKGTLYFSRNFFNLSELSKLTPKIFALTFSNFSNWSRNPHASLVHPGVSAIGKK